MHTRAVRLAVAAQKLSLLAASRVEPVRPAVHDAGLDTPENTPKSKAVRNFMLFSYGFETSGGLVPETTSTCGEPGRIAVSSPHINSQADEMKTNAINTTNILGLSAVSLSIPTPVNNITTNQKLIPALLGPISLSSF